MMFSSDIGLLAIHIIYGVVLIMYTIGELG